MIKKLKKELSSEPGEIKVTMAETCTYKVTEQPVNGLPRNSVLPLTEEVGFVEIIYWKSKVLVYPDTVATYTCRSPVQRYDCMIDIDKDIRTILSNIYSICFYSTYLSFVHTLREKKDLSTFQASGL